MRAPLNISFRPVGSVPKTRDFRCMHFDNWAQVAEYLDALQKPLDALPWVMERGVVISPPEVIARAAEVTKGDRTIHPER